MNRYQNAFKYINNFYKIQPSENFSDEIFGLLNKIIKFESGYIFYTNPTRLEYSYNPKTTDINEISDKYLKASLTIKDCEFAYLIISGENFTSDDKIIFETCASIISNITKDFEISKIIKMQIEALQQVYLQAHESEQIKTEFLSQVSHELRTPLNSIIGYSDLLENEFIGKLNEKQKEYIGDIKISSLHLLGMINEVLDMSKIEAGAMTLNIQEISISRAIEEVINVIKPLFIKKNIKVNINADEIIFEADFQKIQQILFNLLSNAIKYTNENGKINITTQKTSSKLILTIEDNGIGIAPENIDKIFEKFEQVNNSQLNSTGLGLTITKELVKMHNGEISVKSELGNGCKFIIELPLKNF